MEDQGIMALPQGQAMQGPTAQPAAPQVDPAAEAAFNQMRQQVDPKEFGDELLATAAEADPVAVQQFLQAITQLQLPPEVLDALGDMVDAILAEPENYAENRAKFIAEGVPPEILPEEFDAAYFGALNLALDQMSARLPQEEPAPQGFAKGGIATLNPIAAGLAAKGRKGDTQLAHITQSEARMLRRRGGRGTINPATGLREYGISSVFKSVGKQLKAVGKSISNQIKSVGKAIKKFASSTVGKIITTIALGFFLGPAAASFLGVSSAAGVAAVSGFVGSAGSTLLAGGSVKDALKSGVVGGLTAGVGAGVFGGADAFAAGSYTGPTTISGQFESFTNKLSGLAGTPTPPTMPDTATLAGQGTAPPPTTPTTAMGEAIQAPQMVANAPGAGVDVAGTAQNIGPVPGTPGAVAQQTPADFMRSIEPRAMGQAAPFPQTDLGQMANMPPPQASLDMANIGQVPGGTPQPTPGIMDRFKGYTSDMVDFYKAKPSMADLDAAAQAKGYESYAAARDKLVNLDTRSAAQELASINKAAEPTFGTTSRVVGTGIGALALSGGFKQEPREDLNIAPKETGLDLIKKDPTKYSITPGGANVVYGPYLQPPPKFAQGGIAAVAPRRYNMGGFAGYSQGGSTKFPRRLGAINGPGTGTSDSIPAMLSDGEFVFTAKAVRGAGKGSRKEGARRMYAMMKALERKA